MKLIEFRNERIAFAKRTYGIENSLYHCVTRKRNYLNIFETSLEEIDSTKVNITNVTKASIIFTDRNGEYLFNFSKSTLFKKFYIPSTPLAEIEIQILDDPLTYISKTFDIPSQREIKAQFYYVILPLYSTRLTKNGEKVVPEKSGLNQWNAGGRPRDLGEVYIPIPIWIHKKFPSFFPSRDTSFNLHLPDNKILSAKVCQENGKALMTNPNNALADWLLRKVLKLKEGELVTYSKLKKVGVDSVRITKLDEQNFKIDFTKLDSY
ncbi:MAG: hypothetical protein N3A69_18110, partial [Leptospiraceae bacterium]|nr:hypothetical protein [Leptospiraceae bacterium]